VSRSRIDITVGSANVVPSGYNPSGQTNGDAVSTSVSTLTTDVAALTTTKSTIVTNNAPLGTAMAALVADGATPTQAHVTTASNAYNTLNANITTLVANVATVNADLTALAATLTARPDVSVDYSSTVASLNALKAAFAHALRLAASAGIK
jgi:hypothetical protein